MAGVSVSAAAGAGFALIGRKPLIVLAWGMVIFLAGVLPGGGLFALVGPSMMDFFRQAAMHPQSPPDPSQLSGLGGLMLLNPLIQLIGIAFRAVLCAAVFRAVLTPGDSRFAYLRIGMQEVWLAVLFLAETILLGLLMVAIAIPTGIVVVLAFVFLAHWAAALFTVVTVGAVIGLFFWVLLRFALAGPMTFDEGEFRLFESWAVTRGHAAELLGMVLLLFVFILIIEMVLMAVMGVSVFAVFGAAAFQRDQVAAFFQQPPAQLIATFVPIALGLGLFWSYLIAAAHAVLFAPFAAFYGMVRPSPDATLAPPPIVDLPSEPPVAAPA